MKKLTFILGGARSGKSTYAERRAAASGGQVLYVATARPVDEEMRRRIAMHRSRRPADWQTLELSAGVAHQLHSAALTVDVVLVDCLTVLVSNLVLQASADLDKPDTSEAGRLVHAEIEELLQAVRESNLHWLVVSNEVGQGLVPPYPVGRVYRDLLGWANQQMAQAADEVIWMVAGIPVPVGQYRQQQ